MRGSCSRRPYVCVSNTAGAIGECLIIKRCRQWWTTVLPDHGICYLVNGRDVSQPLSYFIRDAVQHVPYRSRTSTVVVPVRLKERFQ
jgi:hypothetical protein